MEALIIISEVILAVAIGQMVCEVPDELLFPAFDTIAQQSISLLSYVLENREQVSCQCLIRMTRNFDKAFKFLNAMGKGSLRQNVHRDESEHHSGTGYDIVVVDRYSQNLQAMVARTLINFHLFADAISFCSYFDLRNEREEAIRLEKEGKLAKFIDKGLWNIIEQRGKSYHVALMHFGRCELFFILDSYLRLPSPSTLVKLI